MDFKTMTVDELYERRAAIKTELETDGADLDSLETEVRDINAELEARRAAEAEAAERRKLVAEGAGEIIEKKDEERKMFEVNSVEYRAAYLKNLMGRELSAEERTGMTAATSSGGYAIPTITLDRIIENMVQVAPMIGEIDLMHIPGNLTIAVESTVNAAALHTELASISGADDTLVKISLSGFEICKVLPISAKLETMSIDAFEQWIVSNLSRSIALEIENYIINGTGSSQPKGIDYAETWTDGTNAVDFASSAPTVAELEELIGYQNGAYIGNAKFLMNWKTFWTQVHVLRDEKFEPVCVHENGVYRIFGFPVVFSAKAADGDIFFGDFREGVKGNFAQDVEVMADRSSGFRYNATDYRGACIFDCQTVAGRIVKGAATL